MKNRNHIRHGDVLLTRVDTLPEGKTINHNGEYILAYGEVTGHAHRLKSDSMKVVESNGVFYVSLTIPSPLTHEEHSTIEIPNGIYRIDKEREYDYAMETINQVKD